MKTKLVRLFATLALMLVVAAGPALADARYMLVTPVTLPGSGGSNPAYLTPVLRFEFEGSGPLNPLSSIPAFPASLVDDPIYAAFNSQGELFVSNRHGNRQGLGSIARFTFNAAGQFTPNGSITGNSLEAVCGLAFSSTGELFAANHLNGAISRFLFDAIGNPIGNGTIDSGRNRNHGLAFASNGELFITNMSSEVLRLLFDPVTGEAIPNGSFVVPGTGRLTFITFNAFGELFISAPVNNLVFRILFDSYGNPVGNGTISVLGGPAGLAFSPGGELFVASHWDGGISRFLFDENGNTIPNGFIQTRNLGGAAILELSLTVEIDIKPDSDPNPINPGSKGLVPVAILSSEDFDATTIDPTTVELAGASVAVRGKDKRMAHEEDVDGDGVIDLVVQVETQDLPDLGEGATVELTGTTFSGQSIIGYDDVIVVAPE